MIKKILFITFSFFMAAASISQAFSNCCQNSKQNIEVKEKSGCPHHQKKQSKEKKEPIKKMNCLMYCCQIYFDNDQLHMFRNFICSVDYLDILDSNIGSERNIPFILFRPPKLSSV